MNRPKRRAPADHRQLPVIVTQGDGLQRNVVRDPRDLVGARLGHTGVVVGIVRDVPGVIVALEATDAMLEPRRSRLDPGPGERLGIAQEGMEAFRVRPIRDGETRQLGLMWYPPRLGGVCQIAVA